MYPTSSDKSHVSISNSANLKSTKNINSDINGAPKINAALKKIFRLNLKKIPRGSPLYERHSIRSVQSEEVKKNTGANSATETGLIDPDLHKAVLNNEIDNVKRILFSKKPNKNAKDRYGQSLLAIAIDNQHYKLCQILIDRGIQDKPSRTSFQKKMEEAVYLAAQTDNLQLLKELLEIQPLLFESFGDLKNTLLMAAAETGAVSVVSFLVSGQRWQPIQYINQRNVNNETALTLAIKNNQIDVLKILFNIQEYPATQSQVLLLSAIEYSCRPAMIEFLLKKVYRDIHYSDERAIHALDLALRRGQYKIAEILINYPKKDKVYSLFVPALKQAAFLNAALRCDMDAMRFMLQHGFDINAVDNLGQTLLERLQESTEAYVNATWCLLELGADFTKIPILYISSKFFPEGLCPWPASHQNFILLDLFKHRYLINKNLLQKENLPISDGINLLVNSPMKGENKGAFGSALYNFAKSTHLLSPNDIALYSLFKKYKAAWKNLAAPLNSTFSEKEISVAQKKLYSTALFAAFETQFDPSYPESSVEMQPEIRNALTDLAKRQCEEIKNAGDTLLNTLFIEPLTKLISNPAQYIQGVYLDEKRLYKDLVRKIGLSHLLAKNLVGDMKNALVEFKSSPLAHFNLDLNPAQSLDELQQRIHTVLSERFNRYYQNYREQQLANKTIWTQSQRFFRDEYVGYLNNFPLNTLGAMNKIFEALEYCLYPKKFEVQKKTDE